MDRDKRRLSKGNFLKKGSKINKRLDNLCKGKFTVSSDVEKEHQVEQDHCEDEINVLHMNGSADCQQTESFHQTSPAQTDSNDSELNTSINLSSSFPVGRRIIDLKHFASQMQCFHCKTLLHLKDFCGQEQRFGAASELPLRCSGCYLIQLISTSSDSFVKNFTADKRTRVYDVNCKLALGMIDNGMGPTHLQNFLADLNVPIISHKTIQRHEVLVGDALESEANLSMQKAVKEEKMLTWVHAEQSLSCGIITEAEYNEFKNYVKIWFEEAPVQSSDLFETGDNTEDETTQIIVPPIVKKQPTNIPDFVVDYCKLRMENGNSCPVGGSVDGAWMKRGNGKCSTSKTGHGTIIGIYTGEVLASDKRNLHCWACRTKSIDDHVCNKNWDGSSKAMESDIIANLILKAQSFQNEKARITAIVGDEDSATMSKISEIVPWKVHKITDVVHAKKNFGNGLYSTKHRMLTPVIINYLKDCFSYAVHQNKDSPDELKKALQNIPEHVFNNHENCGLWCGYKQDPENYKHKRLPEIWKGSQDDQLALKNCLVTVCNKFSAKANSLAPCLSSNANECFNFVVTTLAPKSRHYGGSFSFGRRLYGAVLQKNEGVQFVISVNKSLNLSPGEHTISHKRAVAEKRKRERQNSEKPTEKIKRRKDIQKLLSQNFQKEAAEGVTYKSGLGFEVDLENECNDLEIGVTPLQTPAKTPKKRSVTGTKIAERIDDHINFEIVIFYTETTGLSKHDQILQLAAQSDLGSINFYCFPSVTISEKAKQQHKIYFRNGKLFQDKKELDSTDRANMLQKFIDYLKSHKSKILLVGHNVHFDLRFLWRELEIHGLLDSFADAVAGFCNSIQFFKKCLPELSSYKQNFVCKNVLGSSFNYDEHNAQADVAALAACLDKLQFKADVAREFSIKLMVYQSNLQFSIAVNQLEEHLKKKGGKITSATARSLVQNNLNAEALQGLAGNKTEFLKTVSSCFVRERKKRSESLYEIFSN